MLGYLTLYCMRVPLLLVEQSKEMTRVTRRQYILLKEVIIVCQSLRMYLTIRQLFAEYTTGQDILSFNGHQIGLRDSSAFSKKAVGLT